MSATILAAGVTFGPVPLAIAGGLVLVALLPGLVIFPTLSLLGFTPLGPVAGGIAAGLQTAVTASGSLFALCQSAAMSGAGGSVLGGIVSGIASAGAALVGLLLAF